MPVGIDSRSITKRDLTGQVRGGHHGAHTTRSPGTDSSTGTGNKRVVTDSIHLYKPTGASFDGPGD